MDLFVARQPIFDASNNLKGYELLYRGNRSAEEANASDATTPRQMSSDVIVQNFLEAGVSRLTGGHRGFINFTREMLLDATYELFDPNSIVVELVEDVPADEQVKAACQKMVMAGYTLALDDFVLGGIQEPLLHSAHIVKIDLLNRSVPEIARIGNYLKPYFVTMLAERVETAEVAWAAEKAGFSLFQGYYFSRPETIGHRTADVEALRLFPLLNMVRSDDTPNREIERMFRSDPKLSYKLLQIANAATHGVEDVESINHAITLVGRDVLYRWVSLLLTSSLATSASNAPELLTSTLLRARFMELVGTRSRSDSGPLFLVGLFSNMGVLLGIPLRELLQKVKVTPEVHGALMRNADSPYLPWLELSEAYEEGDWQKVAGISERMHISTSILPEIYMRAVKWSGEMVEVVSRGETPREELAATG